MNLLKNRYFTWDSHKFANPLEMIQNLTALGRHLTIIIDPHIKRDGSYFFHNDCTDRGYYTKNKDGNDYEGKRFFPWNYIIHLHLCSLKV